MVPDRFSPKMKAVIILCCILIFFAGILFVIGFSDQAREREHIIQLHLKNTAHRMAGQVNGDGLLLLKPGDDGSPPTWRLPRPCTRPGGTTRISRTRTSCGWTMVRSAISSTTCTCSAGPAVVPTGELVTEDKDIILNATIRGPQYSDDIYTSKWGSFLSGYAPVRDSNGTVVAVLGVDEPSDTVLQYEFSSMFNLVEVG